MPSLFEYDDGGAAAGGRGGKNRVRACDQCRRKKVRCDGAEILPHLGGPCSNCVAFGYECTYVAASENRFRDVEYVRKLESELAELKEQMRKMQSVKSEDVPDDQSSPFASSSTAVSAEPPLARSSPGASSSGSRSTKDDIDEQETLIEGFKCLNMNLKHAHFLGKSSSLIFVHAATAALKQEFTRDGGGDIEIPPDAGKAIEQENSIGKVFEREAVRHRECWETMTENLLPDPPYPADAFPPAELMASLVEDFFTHLNSVFPLLHRPTVEDGIRSGLHLTDEAFGSTVLVVCAVGARFSSDPRVLPGRTTSWFWAGWDWFQRVRTARKLLPLTPPTYRDLQIFCLLAMYLADSPLSHAVYVIVGHGMRMAQDMGAHRRMAYSATPNAEDEMKKRAFWCLVAMDRGMCHKLGRPYNNHDEDFDAEMPLECDDEYWANDDPTLAFTQPEGNPSKITLFNCMLRLGRIHGKMLRTLYSSHSTALRSNVGKIQQVVSEIDSELNEFMDCVPEHLRWDPNNPDLFFLKQSATLYAYYYTLQITVHRSFIPLPGKPSPLNFPSLAICTNAARSAIHILDAQYVRIGTPLLHHVHQMSVFSSAIILLLNVWNMRRAHADADCSRDIDAVRRAMRLLQILEGRWAMAGRLGDLLSDLVQVIQRPRNIDTHAARPPKRRHEDDTPAIKPTHSPPSAFTSVPSSAQIAAPARPSTHAAHPSSAGSAAASFFPESEFDFALPVYSTELGGVPIWPDTASTLAASNDFWQAFTSPQPAAFSPAFAAGIGSSAGGGAGASGGPFGAQFGQFVGQFGADPDLEAIFANLVPQGPYSDAFSHLRSGVGAGAAYAGGQYEADPGAFVPAEGALAGAYLPGPEARWRWEDGGGAAGQQAQSWI